MAIRGRDLQDVVNIVSVLEIVLTKEKDKSGSTSAIYLCHQMCSQGHPDKLESMLKYYWTMSRRAERDQLFMLEFGNKSITEETVGRCNLR